MTHLGVDGGGPQPAAQLSQGPQQGAEVVVVQLRQAGKRCQRQAVKGHLQSGQGRSGKADIDCFFV